MMSLHDNRALKRTAKIIYRDAATSSFSF